jgi:hypothetical protein
MPECPYLLGFLAVWRPKLFSGGSGKWHHPPVSASPAVKRWRLRGILGTCSHFGKVFPIWEGLPNRGGKEKGLSRFIILFGHMCPIWALAGIPGDFSLARLNEG